MVSRNGDDGRFLTPSGAAAVWGSPEDTVSDDQVDFRAEPVPHIIVVEDDPPLRALLTRLLIENGYEATGVGDGEEMFRIMADRGSSPIDLILLDIMLPGESGLILCNRIREYSKVPIIIVSARGLEADRVAGLDTGADDYIAKPFSRSELLARVRALLRRAGESRIPPEAFSVTRLDFAGWSYFPKRRELLAPSKAEVSLTAAEHDLLQTLLRHPQRTIGRERLIELVRHRIGNPSDRSIDVLVSRLRRKLSGNRNKNALIRTIRGVGYMFAADVTGS
ncbi:putative two-component response regulator [Caenibius tardaugens NBRC 16725]|uniref:Putative two-component response regulator n=1 Tax=Caenibius tardaugens NBRC 16725 TaxID=1219035 RepID=U3A659_9SPHN|nr:response regulator transcription factor [Caenibius tardaugens]AZI35043.1 DNA-binding response regulator [Caenibius tardaugens NBRC 16725]TXG93415.1 MAG: response regulator transcription factor [Rhodocyclaceae bacterium]GAD50223.1 putative two-component response regulator [Caenibius tardaugens NBRC 16725]